MANPQNWFQDNRPLVIGGAYNAIKALTAGEGVLNPGTVMGVVTATTFLRVCGVGNGDGSEVGRYVLTKEVDTDDPAMTTQDVLMAGVVNGDLLHFSGVETLDSVVVASGLTHRENLKANGIIPLTGTDLEAYDNT